jgi:TM2 domain-containing membrane protein YozV
MSGQGSGGNVIAALCTFFIPGLGHLVQGRLIRAGLVALFVWVGYVLYWLIVPGIIALLIHLWAIYDTATFRRPA